MQGNTQNQKQKEQDKQKLKANLDRIQHKLIVISGKGGVGKSTVSVNLAYGLVLNGFKVGILDVDIHGPSLGKMLGIEGKRLGISEDGESPAPIQVYNNLYALTIASLLESEDSPVIWRGPLKMGAIRQFLQDIQWPPLDYLIIDSPPGTGDEPLSVCQVIGDVDGSIIVTTPQDVALLDARKTIKFSQMLNVPVVGIVENMSGLTCPHCGEKIDLFKIGGAQKAADDFDVEMLGAIPIEKEIVDTGDVGRPYIYDFAKKPAAEAMNNIVNRIIEKVSSGDKK